MARNGKKARKDFKRLGKQLRKVMKVQKKLMKHVAGKKAGPLAGAGALLGGLTVLAEKMGWMPKLGEAASDLKHRFMPSSTTDEDREENARS